MKIASFKIAKLAYKLCSGELPLDSGSNVIVVNNMLENRTENEEYLYSYNVDNLKLNKLT